jgi:hypothetical protein
LKWALHSEIIGKLQRRSDESMNLAKLPMNKLGRLSKIETSSKLEYLRKQDQYNAPLLTVVYMLKVLVMGSANPADSIVNKTPYSVVNVVAFMHPL